MTITVEAPPLDIDLTPRIVAAIAHEEGLVLEAYLDSQNVWTWALGVAETGGHNVRQYKDNPQPLEVAIAASIKVMRAKYLPPVQRAFKGLRLKEHEIAGALSFHWNTGKISSASWVQAFRAGDIEDARARYLAWNKPAAIIGRRTRDAALFFDDVWPDLTVPVYSVRKPSYLPGKATGMNLLPIIEHVMGAA